MAVLIPLMSISREMPPIAEQDLAMYDVEIQGMLPLILNTSATTKKWLFVVRA